MHPNFAIDHFLTWNTIDLSRVTFYPDMKTECSYYLLLCSTWDEVTQRETDLKAFSVKSSQLLHKEDDARQNFYKGTKFTFFRN